MSEWQPMETAPMDGTPILGYEREYGSEMVICWWTTAGWVREGDDCNYITEPEFWMPLPEPPEDA